MVFCVTNGKKYFDDRLVYMLRREECTSVLRLIKDIPVSKLSDCHDTTLLHLSAKYNNVFIMKHLVSRGCEIDAVDRRHMTPLLMAIVNESVEAVKFLLDANANIYLSCFYGNSALKIAMRCSKTPWSVSIVKLFFKKMTLELEADCFEIAERLSRAHCPLYRAIYLNNSDVTRIMIRRKPNCVDSRDPDTGNTALHEACNLRDTSNILVLLQNGADVNAKNHEGQAPSVHAFSRNLDILRALLKSDIAWTEPDDYNPEYMKLGQIFGRGNREIVQLFLRHVRVDLRIRDHFARTPLHYLSENDNPGVLELFADCNELDVNALDKGNYAALHYAAARGDPVAVQFLLAKGADANVKGYLGCTPLFYAVTQMSFEIQRKKECIELLVLHGADLEFRKNEETMIEIAQRIGIPHLIEPLLAQFALTEAAGEAFCQNNRKRIDSCATTRAYYQLCQAEIRRMRDDKIYGSLTTYRALTVSEFGLSRYVRIPEVSDRFSRGQFDCNSYYARMLRKRFDRAVEIASLRKTAIQVVSDAIEQFDGYYVIVEMIVSFFDYDDLKRLA